MASEDSGTNGPPAGPPAPLDPRDLRCSDADREVVAEVVRQAAGDGRLTLEEMSERLDAVYAARTYRDLEPVVSDLPGARLPGPGPGSLPATRPPSSPATRSDAAGLARVGGTSTAQPAVAVFGEAKRTGAWVVPEDYASVAVFGSVDLDLREARLAAPRVTVQANAVFGSVTVHVPDDITVSAEGTPVFGEYSGPHEEPTAELPHVTLTGLALFGSVEVKRKPRKRRR